MVRSVFGTCPRPEFPSPGALKTHCAQCAVRVRCLPAELEGDDLRIFDELVGNQHQLGNRNALYLAGDELHALHLIRVGSCITSMLDEDGREQVIGFHMPGDVVGLDGMATSTHTCTAVAAEDSEVCALPFDQMGTLARRIPALQQLLRHAMAREVRRSHGLMLLLGSMRAEERVATFLLDLSQRHHQRGCAASEFVLRMSRTEIGSYLGLQLETVSRLLTRFHLEGMIHVQGREVKLLETVALKRIIGQRG